MSWTRWQWVALIWMLVVFGGSFYLLLDTPTLLDDFWYTLVPPFVTAALLGIWLVAGIGPVWLRLMGMLVGQCLLIPIMGQVWRESPVFFVPAIAATTAVTALAMFGLGCLGSLLPISSTWNVRIALWEIVVSIGLIGVTLAIARILSEMYQWDWTRWARHTGIHFLVFSLYTGVLMTIVLLPLLVTTHRARWFAVMVLLVAVVLIPPLDFWTFNQLSLQVDNLFLFYAAHIAQTVLALAITIPLVTAFPGVLVRQTQPGRKPLDQTEQPSDAEDFAEMQ